MRQKTSNVGVSIMAYHNQDVADLIESVGLEMRQSSGEKAKNLAEVNQPDPDGDSLYNHTSWLRSRCNRLKTEILTLLNVEGLTSKGASLVKRFKDREAELKEKHTELGNVIRKDKKEVKEQSAEDVLEALKVWLRVNWIIIFLLGAETIAMEQAMSALTSMGIIARLGIALPISICTYFLVKLQVSKGRMIHNRLLRALFHIGMTSLAVGIFFTIASMRMGYLTEMNPSLAQRSSQLIFTAISSIFYIGTLFATSMYLVDNYDRRRAQRYLKLQKELALKEDEFKIIDAELAELPKKREEALYECYSLIKMANHYVDQVDFLYEEVLGEFVLENNLARNDGKTISITHFKGGEVPPLKQYSFGSIFDN